jgi:lysyl-tRNA synthetase, class II
LEKYVDVGDIIGVKGEVFTTHKGEPTLFVSDFQLLSKALRPLGDKFHGIGDDQERAYRQRYLDMIFNRETLERMKFRSNFIRALREFYRANGFYEIDCPVMTASASGAAAKPFITHHNDFDRDFYLRICNETELKKATIGGLEKVYTLATNFRNEGSDPSHLQEFMMLEHQNVYASFQEDMTFTEKMFDYVFDTLNIDRKITVKDKQGVEKRGEFHHSLAQT